MSDQRAPTPTAAAEMAVPVRNELLTELLNKERRLISASTQTFERRRTALVSAGRGLGRPEDLLGPSIQRLDRASDHLKSGLRMRVERASTRMAGLRLSPRTLTRLIDDGRANLHQRWARGVAAKGSILDRRHERLKSAGQLLGSLSYENVLKRGFAMVRDDSGKIIRSAGEGAEGAGIAIRFADGERDATLGAGGVITPAKPPAAGSAPGKSSPPKPKAAKPTIQKTLFD